MDGRMIGDELNRWDQLKLLRDFTARTGALHEAQVLQLRIWPLVLFPHVGECAYTWNMKASASDTPDRGVGEHGIRNVSGKVRYEFRSFKPKVAAPKDLPARCGALEKNIQEMLGDGWRIEVRSGGRTIFPIKRWKTKSKKKSRR